METSRLLPLILADDPAVRDQALVATARQLDDDALRAEGEALHAFWAESDNLYERVRALFFLAAIYRFVWPPRLRAVPNGRLPFSGYQHLLNRRFIEAIEHFRAAEAETGLNDNLASALGEACAQLALQNLANQVRRSVRSVRGNQWMFRAGHPDAHPLRLRRELLPQDGVAPIIHERTAVRMDLSHSGWSDIFFLGMDFPEGARVLNVSVDLALAGESEPRPPVEACFRVIDEPLIRLVSLDLGCSA
ncbi:MAG: UTP--glucose-1-phosphate uridylyltransferase, partial [Opitutales bacterium]